MTEPMRLLVGIDGRPGGEDAAELARVLSANADGPHLRLVTVLFTGTLPMQFALLPEEEASKVGDMAEQARQKVAGMPVESLVYCGGSPAAILTEIAEQDQFDTIVVGSPHRGAVGRVLIGSTAMSLLNGSPSDVAVAPKGYAETTHEPFRRIAVAYDGSAEAKAALRRAEGLARSAPARLEVVTVVSPPVATATMAPGVSAPQFPPDPERIIAEGVDSVEPRLGVEGTRLDGDPAMELIRHCEENADLLVLGSRGYGPVARVLLGSVSRRVVVDAPCPVLVVARP